MSNDLKEKAKARQKRANRKELDEAYRKGIPEVSSGSSVARQPIGTNVGNRQRMQEFKNRLLKEENGNRVLQKVLDIAMDDDHPGQMNALKLCMDRMLPTSLFDEDKKGHDKPSIQINITGIGEKVSIESEPIDGELIDG